MADHITYDPAYNTVDRDDFRSMIEVDRYGTRTDAFDDISLTRDHHWDPTDPAYFDFDAEPLDVKSEMIMPRDFIISFLRGSNLRKGGLRSSVFSSLPSPALNGFDTPLNSGMNPGFVKRHSGYWKNSISLSALPMVPVFLSCRK